MIRNICVQVVQVIADKPALAKITGHLNHNANLACQICPYQARPKQDKQVRTREMLAYIVNV